MTRTPITSYKQFCALVGPDERRGYDFFSAVLDHVWEAVPKRVVDWLDFEQFSRDVLGSDDLTDEYKVRLIREALGAFTGRGEA